MDDFVDAIVRCAAERLAGELDDPSLVPEAERILHSPEVSDEMYEPVTLSIAALVVSAASLAWTIFNDTRKVDPTPNKDAISRQIRVQIANDTNVSETKRDTVIDIVVEETLRHHNR